MSENSTFEEIMTRLQSGDQEAATEVFQRFAQRLIHLARSRLDEKLRQKIDPEDVLQSVWKSFFRRHAEGQYHLDDWGSLWSLLVVITLRKCGHKIDYFTAARRDVKLESKPAPSPEDSRPTWEVVANDPTPSHANRLTETIEQVARSLGDEHKRHIFELSLQGFTAEEISQQTQFTKRTVYRVLERIKKMLHHLQQDQ